MNPHFVDPQNLSPDCSQAPLQLALGGFVSPAHLGAYPLRFRQSLFVQFAIDERQRIKERKSERNHVVG